MKAFPPRPVPPALIRRANAIRLEPGQGSYEIEITADDIVFCSGAVPHCDPDLERFSLFWVLRNNGLVIADRKCPDYKPVVGDLFVLDVHEVHSCLPDLYVGRRMDRSNLFAAYTIGFNRSPPQKIVDRVVESVIRAWIT